MSELQKFTDRTIKYRPAQLRTGKLWYVEFYVYNPFTDSMVRKRVKINRVKRAQDRRRYAEQLICEINKKLFSGWNPYTEHDRTRQFMKLSDAIDTYRNSKYKELSENSRRSYNSFFGHLAQFIEMNGYDDIFVGQFSPVVASELMLFVKQNPNVSNRTYNNALAFYRTLFNWFIEFNYIKENPFSAMKKIAKRFTQKKRTYLTREELHMLRTAMEKENPRYLAACMLCYYCFLRDADIVSLRLANFDLLRKVIYIRACDTKNDKDSTRVIPVALERYLSAIPWERISDDDYIFSDAHTFMPGKKKMCPREIGRYWAKKVRPLTGFGMDKQFYSLKDSGISNLMADGVSASFVQRQADHSSLEVTQKYLHNTMPEGYEQLRNVAKDI